MSRLITNDTVFTDTHTDRVWVDELIRQLYKAGEIFSLSDMTTGVLVTPDAMWELTSDSLLYYIDHGDWVDKANPIFINGVPPEVREEDLWATEEFMSRTTTQIAEDVAEYSAEYTSIQDEMGKKHMGYARTALIVVHEDTVQLGGFIPLVRAIRAKQQKFPMLKPMRVYVHRGTRASLRPFEETPVVTRQTS